MWYFLNSLQEQFVDDGRHYEEIHPRETAYEAQPFLTSPNGLPGQKPMNGSFSEPNNNPSNINNRPPPLGENYFILEPNQGGTNAPSQKMMAVHPNGMETFHPGIHGFIPYTMAGHHYIVQGPSPHHQAVQSQHPTVPPAHLIPLREKYIISDHRSLESPTAMVRYPDRNNTIGSCQVSGFRHSPVNFTQDRPGQYSLDRRQNMPYIQRSTSVNSQTILPEGSEGGHGEEEGYDRIDDFRQSIRAPSEKSGSHHYDQVQLTESPSHGTESRSQSTKSTQDGSTSC